MNANVKTEEDRLRRLAKRHDLRLEKSRSRTPSDPTFGGYMLINERNFVVLGAGANPYSATIDQVRDHLAGL